jgi:hypothetical protein
MKAIDTWSRWRIFSSSYKSYKWKRLTLDHILHLDQVSIAVICKTYKRMRIPFTLIKCQSLSFVWSRWRICSSSYKSYKWQRLTLDHGEGYSHPLISLMSIAVICKTYKRTRISFTLIKCQSLSFVRLIRGDHGEGYSHPLISLTNDSDWHLIMVKDILVLL